MQTEQQSPSTEEAKTSAAIKASKPKRKYPPLIIVAGVVVVLIGLFFYYKPWVMAYYIDWRYNPFKNGDKLYAHKRFVDREGIDMFLYEDIRPLNETDVNNMSADLVQKGLAKQGLNSSAKPYLTTSGWRISSDSLRKLKTACIGIYVKSEIKCIKMGDRYYPSIFLVIKPNKKAMVKEGNADIPSGYIEADGPFYVDAYEVSITNNK